MKDDMAATLTACDQHRLASEPDYARFPELRGHIEFLRAGREAFRAASGLSDLEAAHFHSAWYFQTRWLECRHLGRWDILTAKGCTNVFIPEGREGVTIGDNRDIALLDASTSLEGFT